MKSKQSWSSLSPILKTNAWPSGLSSATNQVRNTQIFSISQYTNCKFYMCHYQYYHTEFIVLFEALDFYHYIGCKFRKINYKLITETLFTKKQVERKLGRKYSDLNVFVVAWILFMPRERKFDSNAFLMNKLRLFLLQCVKNC